LNEKQVLMFDHLPQTEKPKKQEERNILQEILLELMEKRRVDLAVIQKETGISWSTLYKWYKGGTTSQLMRSELLKLARFFNVSLEYLCFGIGDDTPVFEKFEGDYSA
jgi:DNA invertase Pin-like site-specific DNA recombinase